MNNIGNLLSVIAGTLMSLGCVSAAQPLSIDYLVEVESQTLPIDKLKQLAVMLDATLLKAQTVQTPNTETMQKPILNGR